jgi:hypothetical protein
MLTMLASYAAYDTSYACYAGCLSSICWLSSHPSYAGWLPNCLWRLNGYDSYAA